MEDYKTTYAYNYGYICGSIEALIELGKKPAASRIEFRQAIKRLEDAYTKANENLTKK